VSRAGYYRQWEESEPAQAEMKLRTAIQEIAAAWRSTTNVLRVMRSDNLLGVRFRQFIPTTDSQHDGQVYVNLAARMTLTGVNQLWVADIAYIRLRTEFVFLAVVIDRFSRQAIGWALDRSLAARVAVAALQKAIASRQPPPILATAILGRMSK
jgi:transposase InsO family protein